MPLGEAGKMGSFIHTMYTRLSKHSLVRASNPELFDFFECRILFIGLHSGVSTILLEGKHCLVRSQG